MTKMSIMRRLYLLTSFLVGIIMVLGGFTYWRSANLYSVLDETVNTQLPAVRYMTLADMLHDSLRAIAIEAIYKAEKKETSEVAEIAKEKDEKIKEFNEYIEKLLALHLSSKTLSEVNSTKPVLKSYTEACSKVVDLAKEGKVAEAEALMPDFEKRFKELEGKMETMGEDLKEEASTFSSSTSNTLFVIGLISVLGVVLGLSLCIWTIRNVNRNIKEFISEVVKTSESISHVSERLSTANNQFSSSATQGATSLQQTVASLDELSSMVLLNTENAQKASQVSIQSRESAQRGEKEIQDLSEAMNAIKSSSTKMEEIINVIDEIAFQTNLLALNAAVEAARAGEQGRGFAVVAEAVRSLAQRSSSAAKDINSMIQESLSKIDSGGRIVDSSREALHTIFNSIKEVSDLNQQISSASTEQSAGIKQISQAMNQLDTASQQTANGAQEVSSVSQQMFEESNRLKDFIKKISVRFLGANFDALNIATVPEETKKPAANLISFLKVKTQKKVKPKVEPKRETSSGGIVIDLEEASQKKPLFENQTRKISNLDDF